MPVCVCKSVCVLTGQTRYTESPWIPEQLSVLAPHPDQSDGVHAGQDATDEAARPHLPRQRTEPS